MRICAHIICMEIIETTTIAKQYPFFLSLLNSFKEVYAELGHGLKESSYHNALKCEFEHGESKLNYKSEVEVFEIYKGFPITCGRLDLLIEDEIIVEIKALSSLCDKNIRQLHNYLIHAGKKMGILVNFPEKYTEALNVILLVLNENGKYQKVNLRISVSPKEIHKIEKISQVIQL